MCQSLRRQNFQRAGSSRQVAIYFRQERWLRDIGSEVICIGAAENQARKNEEKMSRTMPMASDTKREIKMSEEQEGTLQDKGMERRAAIWVWSQGLKGMSRQRDYMSMPGGLSLDMAP